MASDIDDDGTEDEGNIGGGDKDRTDSERGAKSRGPIDIGVLAPIERSWVDAAGFRK